jgi:hypothetical protein
LLDFGLALAVDKEQKNATLATAVIKLFENQHQSSRPRTTVNLSAGGRQLINDAVADRPFRRSGLSA